MVLYHFNKVSSDNFQLRCTGFAGSHQRESDFFGLNVYLLIKSNQANYVVVRERTAFLTLIVFSKLFLIATTIKPALYSGSRSF